MTTRLVGRGEGRGPGLTPGFLTKFTMEDMMTQMYRARSGVLVVNDSTRHYDEHDSLFASLYGTYRRWVRKAIGIEDPPGVYIPEQT